MLCRIGEFGLDFQNIKTGRFGNLGKVVPFTNFLERTKICLAWLNLIDCARSVKKSLISRSMAFEDIYSQKTPSYCISVLLVFVGCFMYMYDIRKLNILFNFEEENFFICVILYSVFR